jgi:hypothetical protein
MKPPQNSKSQSNRNFSFFEAKLIAKNINYGKKSVLDWKERTFGKKKATKSVEIEFKLA